MGALSHIVKGGVVPCTGTSGGHDERSGPMDSRKETPDEIAKRAIAESRVVMDAWGTMEASSPIDEEMSVIPSRRKKPPGE